ncbi:MAG: hypothetical protein J0G29_05195 [Alphaproteobacteria bacterium]|nr:hypothetical protein [Alphaproteobacteria bacterium]OJV45151.1 MAG: hypothetical protein BGO28_03975 [Alphaproteobacteria bacterium 43-37]
MGHFVDRQNNPLAWKAFHDSLVGQRLKGDPAEYNLPKGRYQITKLLGPAMAMMYEFEVLAESVTSEGGLSEDFMNEAIELRTILARKSHDALSKKKESISEKYVQMMQAKINQMKVDQQQECDRQKQEAQRSLSSNCNEHTGKLISRTCESFHPSGECARTNNRYECELMFRCQIDVETADKNLAEFKKHMLISKMQELHAADSDSVSAQERAWEEGLQALKEKYLGSLKDEL